MYEHALASLMCARLPVISSQSDFVTNDYVTDGILSTEKTEQAYLLTILYYHCIKIKVLTKNSSH